MQLAGTHDSQGYITERDQGAISGGHHTGGLFFGHISVKDYILQRFLFHLLLKPFPAFAASDKQESNRVILELFSRIEHGVKLVTI